MQPPPLWKSPTDAPILFRNLPLIIQTRFVFISYRTECVHLEPLCWHVQLSDQWFHPLDVCPIIIPVGTVLEPDDNELPVVHGITEVISDSVNASFHPVYLSSKIKLCKSTGFIKYYIKTCRQNWDQKSPNTRGFLDPGQHEINGIHCSRLRRGADTPWWWHRHSCFKQFF